MSSYDRPFPSTTTVSRNALVRGAAMLGLLVGACNFITYNGVVPANQFSGSGIGALAVSYDGTTVWMRSQSNLKVFDTTTGSQVASTSLTGNWFVRAIAPSVTSGYRDVNWTLHKNGVRRRWYGDLSGYDSSRAAIPTNGATAADSRTYCDLDLDSSGVHFIVTVDVVSSNATSYVYREQTEGTWTRTAVTELAGSCGKISTDSFAGEVAVLTDFEVVEYDSTTLVNVGTVDLSALSGNLVDIAHANTHLIIASKEPGDAVDSLVSIDKSGTIVDTVQLDSARAVFVQGVNSPMYRAWWTGRDTDPTQYRVGYWTIENGVVN